MNAECWVIGQKMAQVEGGALQVWWSGEPWGGVLGAETDGVQELGTASRAEGCVSQCAKSLVGPVEAHPTKQTFSTINAGFSCHHL